MRIVLTLADADDPELLDAQLAFHLNVGVDLVVVDGSVVRDDTRDIVDSYAAEGYLQVAGRGTGRKLTALAAEHAADWVVAAESGEFWWPRGEDLPDVLVAIPPRYGVVQGLVRQFMDVQGPEPFAERMTVRRSLASPAAGPRASERLLRPLYRVSPEFGSDAAAAYEGQVLRAWYPVEVLRFAVGEWTDQSALPGEPIKGLPEDALVIDERLRDALRALRADDSSSASSFRISRNEGRALTLRAPSVVDDAAYAVECAAVGEVDLDRIDAQIRELEDRIALLEQRFWPRVTRALARAARRLPGSGSASS